MTTFHWSATFQGLAAFQGWPHSGVGHIQGSATFRGRPGRGPAGWREFTVLSHANLWCDLSVPLSEDTDYSVAGEEVVVPDMHTRKKMIFDRVRTYPLE